MSGFLNCIYSLKRKDFCPDDSPECRMWKKGLAACPDTGVEVSLYSAGHMEEISCHASMRQVLII